MEYAEQFSDIDTRRVFLTIIGPFEVSTVFLGLDHNWGRHGPPILFETMTFEGHVSRADFHQNVCDGRDATWPEAEARHRRAVEFLRVNYCAPGEVPEDISIGKG